MIVVLGFILGSPYLEKLPYGVALIKASRPKRTALRRSLGLRDIRDSRGLRWCRIYAVEGLGLRDLDLGN